MKSLKTLISKIQEYSILTFAISGFLFIVGMGGLAIGATESGSTLLLGGIGCALAGILGMATTGLSSVLSDHDIGNKTTKDSIKKS